MSVTIITPIVWSASGAAIQVQPQVFSAERDPTPLDSGPIGAGWLNSVTLMQFTLGRIDGITTWIPIGGGSQTFTDLTVTGNTTLNTLTVEGLTTFEDNVNFEEDIAVQGNTQLDTMTATGVATFEGETVLDSGGNVHMSFLAAAEVSPNTAVTIDMPFGVANFSGFTIAPAAGETFTINNALVADLASPLIVTVCTGGTNDAQLTITRVKRNAGSFSVTVANDGAAALNGDVTITFILGLAV